mgnify:CR=1 FL=1
MMTYPMHVAGLVRDLPICKVTEDFYIGAFIMFGDAELTVACARDLLKLAEELDYDYLLTAEADVWLNVGNIPTLGELRTRYPKFADVRCVRQGAVYNCDRRITPAGGNDYWESGVVRPDLVLRDLIRIFHPELVSEDFYYYRQVE